jgi:hypothetical protein
MRWDAWRPLQRAAAEPPRRVSKRRHRLLFDDELVFFLFDDELVCWLFDFVFSQDRLAGARRADLIIYVQLVPTDRVRHEYPYVRPRVIQILKHSRTRLWTVRAAPESQVLNTETRSYGPNARLYASRKPERTSVKQFGYSLQPLILILTWIYLDTKYIKIYSIRYK